MSVEVVTPEENMGDVIGDLNKRRGRIMGMNPIEGGKQEILAECPMLSILPEIMVADHPLFDALVRRPFEPDKVRARLYLVWHRLHEHDPAQQFIRDWLLRHFAAMSQ